MKAGMKVVSEILLTVAAEKRHVESAREAADSLTDDGDSVCVEISSRDPRVIVTEFTISKARQMDVVDHIARVMRYDMDDYDDQTIYFPKTTAEIARDKRKLERAKERRRAARLAKLAGDLFRL